MRDIDDPPTGETPAVGTAAPTAPPEGALIRGIIEEAQARFGSYRALAEAAGISVETLRLVVSGKAAMSHSTAARLDAACGVTAFTEARQETGRRRGIFSTAVGVAVIEAALASGVPVSSLLRKYQLNYHDLKRLAYPSPRELTGARARRQAALAELLGVTIGALPQPQADGADNTGEPA